MKEILTGVMTPEKFYQEMKEFAANDDIEERHCKMDDLMCDLLATLGYEKGIATFLDTMLWYA